jgi:hypothetical protein
MALWVRQRNVDTVPVPVSIHRLDPSIPLPAYQTTGAAGFDLASSVDMMVQPGEVTLVPTGLVIEVPKGHVLGVFARSSTPLKRGLMVANGVGVVDSTTRAGGRDQNRGLQLHGGARRRQAWRPPRAGLADSGRPRGMGRARTGRAIARRGLGRRGRT